MLAKSPDIAFYCTNTTGKVKYKGFWITVGKWFRRNVKNENHDGLSDITGMTITGQWFSIEAKIPGKEPTTEQWDHINFVIYNGGLAGYATSVLEAEQIIRQFEINIS